MQFHRQKLPKTCRAHWSCRRTHPTTASRYDSPQDAGLDHEWPTPISHGKVTMTLMWQLQPCARRRWRDGGRLAVFDVRPGDWTVGADADLPRLASFPPHSRRSMASADYADAARGDWQGGESRPTATVPRIGIRARRPSLVDRYKETQLPKDTEHKNWSVTNTEISGWDRVCLRE